MNLFEPTHLLIVLVIVLVLFGGKKIPELMRGVGQGVGELQKGLNDAKKKLDVNADPEPTAASKDNPAETAAKSSPVATQPEKAEVRS